MHRLTMKINRVLAVVMFGFSMPVLAIENIEINSFLSIAASQMSEDGRYLDKVTEHLSYENDSVYGFNIRTKVNDKVSGAAQLLATAHDSTFNVEAEWAYMSYKFNRSLSVRAGMLNLSTFLISDYINTGYLYPWIRTPVEVYENNPLKNFLGLEWLHISRIGKKAKLTSQFFIGSAQVEKNGLLFRATDGYGFNLQLDVPHFTFRLGGITPTIQLEGPDPVSGQTTVDYVDLDDRGLMYTVGAKLDWNNFILYTEAVATDTEGSTQAIFPNQNGSYVTLGYQIGKYLPHVTVASSDGDIYTGALPTGITSAATPLTQDSITYGLRYDVNDSVALKLEYQMIELTPGKGDGFGTIDANTATPGSVENYDVITFAMDVIF